MPTWSRSARWPVGHDVAVARRARVQLFLFQQFLMLFLLTPITGAMALAAHAIVGEKQARTLEPLLATPMTTVRAARRRKSSARCCRRWRSRWPASRCTSAASCSSAAPGVAAAMASPRTLLLIFWVGAGRGAGVAAIGDHHLLARQRRAHGATVRRPHHHPAHRRSWSRSSPARSGCRRRCSPCWVSGSSVCGCCSCS